MIEVQEKIVVSAPSDQVWSLLSDPESVVLCVPGLTLTEPVVDGAFAARLTVRFGPMRVGFSGTGEFTLDDQARTGRLTAKGRDGRGGTKFQATVDFALTDRAPQTTVIEVSGQVTLAGALAGVIDAAAASVIRDITRDFADELAVRCGGAPTSGGAASLPPGSDAAVVAVEQRPRPAAPVASEQATAVPADPPATGPPVPQILSKPTFFTGVRRSLELAVRWVRHVLVGGRRTRSARPAKDDNTSGTARPTHGQGD